MASYGSASDSASFPDQPLPADPAGGYGLREIGVWEEQAKQFSLYVKIICATQLIFNILLLFNPFWFANFIGLTCAVLGLVGVMREKSEFVLTFFILVCMVFIKNIGFLIQMFKLSHMTGWEVVSVVFAILEEVTVCPLGAYCGFKLYRALQERDPAKV